MKRKVIMTSLMLSAFVTTYAQINTEASFEREIISNEKSVLDLSALGKLDAYSKRLSNDVLAVYSTGYADKADVLGALRAMSDVHYSMEDVKVLKISDKAALIAYKMTQDWTEAGKKLARQYYVSSLWTKDNGKWLSRFWQETDIAHVDSAEDLALFVAIEKRSGRHSSIKTK